MWGYILNSIIHANPFSIFFDILLIGRINRL